MIEEYSAKFNIDSRLIEHLIEQGIDTKERINDFLNPSIDKLEPLENYPDAKHCGDIIHKAILDNKRILIYGDYDCDGICSTAMLYLYLMSINANVFFYIPNRFTDGYGLNVNSIKEQITKNNINCVITVDCGVSNAAEIEDLINELNVQVIVTDHHLPSEQIPKCPIFDPKLGNSFSDLAGAGVVLRLIDAMAGREEMLKYIDLACLATIGDLMPLKADNRIIVSYGLSEISRKPRKGVEILMKICKAKSNSIDFAFKVIPKINAVGRLGDANKVVELFTSNEYFVLDTLARELENCNKRRQEQTESCYSDALKMLEGYDLINNRIIALYNENWELGILGITASRIAKEFNRPTILFGTKGDNYKGSGRSIKAINIHSVLSEFRDDFVRYGGHAQAVGITIHNSYLDTFIEKCNHTISKQYSDDIYTYKLSQNLPLYTNDTIKLFDDLNKLAPFGIGNPKPKFSMNLEGNNYTSISNSSHIRSEINCDMEIVGFNMLSAMQLLNSGASATVNLSLDINKYNHMGQGKISDIHYDLDRNSDYFQAVAYKQLLFADKAKCDYKIYKSINELPENNNIFGTLYVANSVTSWYNVCKRIENISPDVLTATSQNPINRVILAPVRPSKIAKYYKRLVFVDRPVKMGYIKQFLVGVDKKVEIINNPIHLCKVDLGNVDAIEEAIYKAIAQTRYKGLDAVYEKVLKHVECKWSEFLVVFYSIYELNKIKIKENFNLIRVNNNSNIKESEIYRYIDGQE